MRLENYLLYFILVLCVTFVRPIQGLVINNEYEEGSRFVGLSLLFQDLTKLRCSARFVCSSDISCQKMVNYVKTSNMIVNKKPVSHYQMTTSLANFRRAVQQIGGDFPGNICTFCVSI